MSLKRMLLVDDSDEFRGMLKEFLLKQNLGLEIFEASTGEMGVAKAAFVQPHIVLMDINLPRANGLEAARQIKIDHPGCQIIVLTMLAVKLFKDVAKEIDVAGFIGKNEIEELLVPTIKKCLAGSVKASH